VILSTEKKKVLTLYNKFQKKKHFFFERKDEKIKSDLRFFETHVTINFQTDV
jgi:hypothetical protein